MLIAAAAAALLAATTWISLRGGAGSAAEGAPASPDRIELLAQGGRNVGDPAPEFTASTTNGEDFSLPADKPAVLFFMAGWCATCYPEAAALARIGQEYGDDVAILAVSPDPNDNVEALRQFADQVDARYGFVHDKDGALTAALGIQALDTTVVVDADGTIVYRDGVPTSEPILREALAKAGLT
ncbi:peroxiredoxin family protein [Geodermatophilus chilensis]|uniref:peroxiredoxin family protein n=1 Tax=Geodermatophilus chilensis TaxID=2035835 RepID=UPI0013000168|nr:peroxiredoxin family protein [Geodermatophilus chilensis]